MGRVTLGACLLIVLGCANAAAQTNLQLWGNLTLNWVKSERLTYELDFEPSTRRRAIRPGEAST